MAVMLAVCGSGGGAPAWRVAVPIDVLIEVYSSSLRVRWKMTLTREVERLAARSRSRYNT